MHSKRVIKAILLLLVLVAGVIVFWYTLQRMEHLLIVSSSGDIEVQDDMSELYPEVVKKVRINGSTYTYDHEIETWLLLGTDASGNENGTGEEYRGSMADFLLLAVFDKTDKTYGFLQLNRDTITEITLLQTDGTGMASADIQLCTAHWYGGTPEQGCENTVKAVSRLLGDITIDGYYSIGMDEIGALNQAVGGVEVTVFSDFTDSDPTMKMGETLVLNDEQAYHYIHDRLNVGDGSNVDRMKRQRQYMNSLFAKVKERTSEEPAFINSLYRDMETAAVTTMTGRDLSRLMKRVDEGENRGIFEIEGIVKRGYVLGDGIEHAEFYPDETSLEETMIELYHLKRRG